MGDHKIAAESHERKAERTVSDEVRDSAWMMAHSKAEQQAACERAEAEYEAAALERQKEAEELWSFSQFTEAGTQYEKAAYDWSERAWLNLMGLRAGENAAGEEAEYLNSEQKRISALLNAAEQYRLAHLPGMEKEVREKAQQIKDDYDRDHGGSSRLQLTTDGKLAPATK